MAARDTLTIIAEEIGLALRPLQELVETPEDAESFLKDLGWDTNGPVQSVQDLVTVAAPVAAILESGEINTGNVQALLAAIKNLVTAIEALSTKADAAYANITATAAEFKADFPRQLPQYLIVEYLLNEHDRVGSLLQLAGLIRVTRVEPTATRPEYLRREVQFDAFGQLFSNPLALLQTRYGWGTPSLNKEELFEKLTTIFMSYALRFRLQ